MCFHLFLLPLVLSVGTKEKSDFIFFSDFLPFHQVVIQIGKIPLTIFVMKLDIPSSLSLCSCERCSSPFINFVILYWACPSECKYLLCWGHTTLGLRGLIPSPDLLVMLCLMQPRRLLAFFATYVQLSTRIPRSSIHLLS